METWEQLRALIADITCLHCGITLELAPQATRNDLWVRHPHGTCRYSAKLLRLRRPGNASAVVKALVDMEIRRLARQGREPV